MVAMARLTGDELAAFVTASCERSAVSVKVTDSLVMRSVALLLTGTPGGADRESAVPVCAS